jgi:hypothetical protein
LSDTSHEVHRHRKISNNIYPSQVLLSRLF